MTFPAPVPLKWIAEFINAELIGSGDASATGINEIHNVRSGDLVFVDHPKYFEKCLQSAASFIIINQKTRIPEGKALLLTPEPFEAYAKLVNHFYPFQPPKGQLSPTAVVGENTVIFPGAYIGHGVHIGKNCIIHPQVTILDNCILGNDVVIQAGTTIGSDAFYYNGKKNREYHYRKMPSCGRVVIGNQVEIGAGCTIDRGVSSDTIIHDGSKLDNLIHIGHDTVIGKNCLFAAGVMIAGCVQIGNGVTLWGQVIVNKTLTIGDGAVVLAKSGVGGSLEGNKTYWGAPAQDALMAKKELVWIKRIPEIWERIMKNPKP